MTRQAAARPAPAARGDDAPATLDACRRCARWEHATQPVPGAGPVDAPIMVVGEQPGDQEDRKGLPFVGAPARIGATSSGNRIDRRTRAGAGKEIPAESSADGALPHPRHQPARFVTCAILRASSRTSTGLHR
ncbi:uracil-DNA glycosylase family protein [Burkholderia pyrrocinia]|uniref:uracil-DNA glycosylase family protein n=1 Tax=Burkholderia pyrrocinia TaxID=60550 RepID=UPI003263A6B9